MVFTKSKSLEAQPTSLNQPLMQQKELMDIADYLDERLIVFLDVETRDEAIQSLIQKIPSTRAFPNQEAFLSAVLQREQIVSTGIGMGVAIPHAKLASLNDFFIVIGIQRKKGIEWNALDKAPVRLIFLIGGPDHRQAEYLQILSRLTMAIKDIETRKEILKAETAKEVFDLF